MMPFLLPYPPSGSNPLRKTVFEARKRRGASK